MSFTGNIIIEQKNSNVSVPLRYDSSSGSTIPMTGTDQWRITPVPTTTAVVNTTKNESYEVMPLPSPRHMYESVFKSECPPKTAFPIPMTENSAYGALPAPPTVSESDLTENACYGLRLLPNPDTQPEYANISDLK